MNFSYFAIKYIPLWLSLVAIVVLELGLRIRRVRPSDPVGRAMMAMGALMLIAAVGILVNRWYDLM